MRKGVEQPQLIVYVLFTVVLTLSGIYVSFVYLGGIDIAFEMQGYASKLNIVTTGLLSSPECYAVEVPYTSPAGTFYQIDFGTINWQRFNLSSRIPSECIATQEKQAWAELEFFDSPYVVQQVWSCPYPLQPGCDVPDAQERADINVWGGERNMLVLIQNGTKLSQGRLTVMLKKVQPEPLGGLFAGPGGGLPGP